MEIIPCPRVERRISCDECGYADSEARELFDENKHRFVHHIGNDDKSQIIYRVKKIILLLDLEESWEESPNFAVEDLMVAFYYVADLIKYFKKRNVDRECFYCHKDWLAR